MTESLGVHSYITSAKEQVNVQLVFRDLTVQILQNWYLVNFRLNFRTSVSLREARRKQAGHRLLVNGGQEPQQVERSCFGRLWDKLFG